MSSEVENIYTWNIDALSIFLRYFLFAGISYLIFYVWKYKSFSEIKIQKKLPESDTIKREIFYSIITLAFYCLTSWLVFYWFNLGITKIYLDITEFGYGYFAFSIILIIIIHDAYFYWTHRLMHIPVLFKWIHKVHHRSDNPNPWSAFSFHPLEAIISVGIIPLIVFTLPIHPYALFIFLSYMTLINVMGHLGFETFPNKLISSKLGKFQNTSTNHNIHHQNSKYNYGLYFTFWDRVMKTFSEKK